MAAEENKAVIRRLFDEVVNGQNLDVLDELVTEDVVNHSATTSTSAASRASGTSRSGGSPPLPDGRYEVLDMIAKGDMVACRVRVSGTMRGELFGVPPTGKSFTAEHVHWHRVVDGKLAERWAVRDDLGTLIQLGIVDPPGRFKADGPD